MKAYDINRIFPAIVMVIFGLCHGSCKKDDERNTVTDIDGNVYHTVAIGSQVWMVENLKVSRYRNGDTIKTTNPDTLYIPIDSTRKYQWAYDGDDNLATVYGRLYTWYAVKDIRNVCPVGWHIPDNDEWTELTDYLGGASIAAPKLKEAGLEHWNYLNSDATNESGFTALPGGFRSSNGRFYAIGDGGFWWSATPRNSGYAYGRIMESDDPSVFTAEDLKVSGLSIRCVKD